MLVRIIKDWDYPDLMKQTPDCSGTWNKIHFTEDEVKECDFLIVLNRIPKDTTVVCNPANVFAVIQEPPVKEYKWLKRGYASFNKIISPEKSLSPKIINDQPALPWHIGKNYDELQAMQPFEKKMDISWVTSNLNERKGHQNRLSFLNSIEGKLEFDLWGRGLNPIEDKWQGIAPYKYSIAIENHRCNYYWTEKIADCFLSWTMPIYYGCKNILKYFPQESMIFIDIAKPHKALESIDKAISDNTWEKNVAAIAHARKMIINEYQFFPLMSYYIKKYYKKGDKMKINFKELPYLYTTMKKHNKIYNKIKSYL